MSDPIDPLTLPLGQRLMLATRDFITTPITDPAIDPDGRLEIARALLADLALKSRDEDTPITPEDAPKTPRLIVTASDEGRTANCTPIRNFALKFAIRANAKVPAGKVDPFHALTGALEALLDGLNLRLALSSATQQIAVMLATRAPGEALSVAGNIRTQSYSLNVRAVGLEHCES